MDRLTIEALKSYCKNLRVLYVEDDVDIQALFVGMLREFFKTIETANDGLQALELFNTALETVRPYDLILVDLTLPKLSGLELIQKIRNLTRDVPVVVISAHNDSEHFIQTIRLGVNGYILKPVELNQLLETLTFVVQNIRAIEETHQYMHRLEQTIRMQEDTFERQLNTDFLTNLPNKHMLDVILNSMSPTEIPSLFVIKIDQFRNYKKLFGIDVSHEILKQFAIRFESVAKSLRYEAFCISYNEFVMFRLDDELDLESIYEDITEFLSQMNAQEIKLESIDEKVLINISLGVAFDQENLVKKAYTALDYAQKTGKPFVVYTGNLDETESLSNDFYWQDVIADSLNKDNVVPFFQPICNAHKEIVKYEALIRIRTKDKNGHDQFISPYHFLDISIRTKQYDHLSFRMMEKVFDVAEEHPFMLFSINFSFRDMLNKNMKELVRERVLRYQLRHQTLNVVFEVVESEQIDDLDAMKNFFKYIRFENAPIAIDDFGTGYSNFSHIMELQPTYLKIDGSLIKHLDTDLKSLQLVKAIVSFARALNIKVIAEYVHNETVFNIAKDIGVDEFQGYFIGEPQSTLLT